VLRTGEDLTRRPVLDGASRVHHQDVVSKLSDHSQVVRDDHHCRIELGLQVADQVEDLGLHRHVQSGRRLVGDEQLGVTRQRHRDHRALPHAAGELVRVVIDARARLRDADPIQQLHGAAARGLLADVVVQPVRLDDLLTHRVVRVHRGQRILKDHRHGPAP
jgi:hypothetical protein